MLELNEIHSAITDFEALVGGVPFVDCGGIGYDGVFDQGKAGPGAGIRTGTNYLRPVR